MVLKAGKPQDVAMSFDRVEHLRAPGQQWVEDGRVSALVVLVARRGTIVLQEVFGRVHPDRAEPPALDTLFPFGSASTLLTITAAMAMVDDGMLGLNRPVSTYLPEFRGEGKDKVMVYHLLEHTSGFRDAEVGFPSDMPLPAQYLVRREGVEVPPLESDQHPKIHEYLHLTYDALLNREPRSEMSYGHYATELLGEIIRRVAGKPLPDFARERLFEPLGMKDTCYAVPPSEKHRIVQRPAGANHGPLLRWFEENDVPWASLSAFTSPRDMAIFGQMFLNKGRYGDVRVLSPAAVYEMTRNQVPGLSAEYRDEHIPEASWGLGWNVHTTKRALGDGSLQSPEAFYQGNSGGPIVWVDPIYEIVGVYFSTTLKPIEDEWPGDLFMNAVTAAVDD